MDQANPPNRFCVKSFARQKQKRKVSGFRRIDILFANVLRAALQLRLQSLHRRLYRSDISLFLSRGQTLVVFHRKFRVDRQPHRRAVIITRQFNRELDALVRVIAHLHIFGELLRRQHFFEQNAELPFAPAAARFHVRQHALQSADVTRELLHGTQALVHLLQTLAHQFERFAQTFFQRALQLFIDRRTHLVDLLGVVLLQFFQAKINNGADAFERLTELFTLVLRSRCAFLAISRKLVAQPSIKQLEAADQFRLHFGTGAANAAVASDEKENNRG